MPSFQRPPVTFGCRGIHLVRPADRLPEGKFRILQNVRAYREEALEPRKGFLPVSPAALGDLSVHSLKRLNNPLPGATPAWTRFVGAGGKIYSGQSSFTERDSGYSGNPLAMVPFRPEQSPEAWLYVGDSARMRKVKADGSDYAVGIVPPAAPPTVELEGFPYTILYDFEGGVRWVAGGVASAATSTARVNTTISAILYDSGSAGWCSIAPASMSNLGLGSVVKIGGEGSLPIREIHPAISGTTVGAIIYDSGNTGLCTVAATALGESLGRNSLVQIGAELVRVVSVTEGPDGTRSFRCSTANTHTAGEAIAGVDSFRIYTVNSHAAAEAIVSNADTSTLTIAAEKTSGTGYLTAGVIWDLSLLWSRPVAPEDEIHISLMVSDISRLSEGKILFDVDANTQDFTQNYYWKAFRPSDLTPATAAISVLSTVQRATQREIIESKPWPPDVPEWMPYNPYPGWEPPMAEGEEGQGPVSQQLGTGQGQWFELRFKFSELVRVGTDLSRTLKHLAKVRVQWTIAGEEGESVQVKINSFYYSGGYGPDVRPEDMPLQHRYRYRSSATGAKSIPSPATRSGVLPSRQQVALALAASADPQVDKIDIERFGGTLNEWHYVGTAANNNPYFQDPYSDGDILGNPPLETNVYQPFPVIDAPKSGTCHVAGTAVQWVSGDPFSTSWAPGTQIRIDGVPYTLYGPPASANILHLVQSAGVKTGVSWTVEEPVLMGTPLPCLWGPMEGFLFGCGDPRNPGRQYYTQGNNPDAAPLTHYIDITSPSEPLMNGVMCDARSLVASSERWFDLRPSFGGVNLFSHQEVPVGRGLYARWALATDGYRIWFLSKDGIYQTAAGAPAASITDGDLYPLFPHEGQDAQAVEGINPPDMTRTADLRLSYYDGFLYFDYVDTAGARRTLVYDTARQGWFPDVYTPGVICHYGEEGDGVHSLLLGGCDGRVYQAGSASDGGTAIACHVRTGCSDQGEPRARKLYGDILLDAEPDDATLTVIAGFDLYTALLAAVSVTGLARGQTTIDIDDGNGRLARDLALDIAWSSATATPRLYLWEPSFVPRPEDSLKRATDWDDAGTPGAKHVRGVLIEADTASVARTVRAEYDGGALGAALTINHTGQLVKPYAIAAPFVGHLLRLRPTDAGEWMLLRAAWIFDPYPELAALILPWSDGGYAGAKFVQGMRLKADSGNAAVQVQVQSDGGSVETTVTARHNGQETKPYSWTPFVAHNLRLAPLGAIRIFEPVEWIYEPMPEAALVWKTQPTTHDLSGFQHLRLAYIAHMATSDVQLTVYADGKAYLYTIGHAGGAYRKSPVGFRPMKAKAWEYEFRSGQPFRLFGQDCEVWVKSWGDPGPYRVLNPFGDLSRVTGARI